MAEKVSNEQLQQRANGLRGLLTTLDGIDTNHDHRLSKDELSAYLLKQYQPDPQYAANPIEGLKADLTALETLTKVKAEWNAWDSHKGPHPAELGKRYYAADAAANDAQARLSDVLNLPTELKAQLASNKADGAAEAAQAAAYRSNEAKESRAADKDADAPWASIIAHMDKKTLAEHPEIEALLKLRSASAPAGDTPTPDSDVMKTIRTLRQQLAAYTQENIASPTLGDLSQAVNKTPSPGGGRSH